MLLMGNEYLFLLGLGSSAGLISNGDVNDSLLAITSSSNEQQKVLST